MLLYHLDVVFKILVSFFLVVWAMAVTAYRINSNRTANDPKKRYYHPIAIFLAPFIAPVVFLLAITAFILAAILYGIFIILFALLLVALRRPFLLVWWNRFSTLVGEPLLRIGTYLILLPFRLINPRSVQRPAAYGNL